MADYSRTPTSTMLSMNINFNFFHEYNVMQAGIFKKLLVVLPRYPAVLTYFDLYQTCLPQTLDTQMLVYFKLVDNGLITRW